MVEDGLQHKEYDLLLGILDQKLTELILRQGGVEDAEDAAHSVGP